MPDDKGAICIWGIVDYLLNSDDGKRRLEESLAATGATSSRSKLAARTLLFIAAKSICGCGESLISRMDHALKEKHSIYRELSKRLTRVLQHRTDSSRATTEILDVFLQPSNMLKRAETVEPSDGLKTTVHELETLDLISLGLGDLHISLSLETGTCDLTPEMLRKPNRLLNPAYQFTPLIGRESELNELQEFRDSKERFSWLVLVGQSGIGKTRLALQFGQESTGQGWYAGFVARATLARFVKHPEFDDWQPTCDTLIMLDRAATKTELLVALIKHCAHLNVARRDSPEGPELKWRVRILLLEPHDGASRGWFAHLLSVAEGEGHCEVRHALAKIRELRTPRISGRQAAVQEILEAFMQRWRMYANIPPPGLPSLTTEELGIIEKNTAGRPLFLQMIALESCLRNDVSCIFQWGRGELLHAAVEREFEYVRQECASDKMILLIRRVIALLCLVGPRSATEPEWQSMLREEADSLGGDQEQLDDVSSTVQRIVGACGEIERDLLYPIEPTSIAGAFIALVLSDRNQYQMLHDSLGRALKVGAVEAWSVLLGMVRDLYGLRQFRGIESWPNVILDCCEISDLLNIVPLLLGSNTIPLNSFAVDVILKLLVHLPATEEARPIRAMWCRALAERYELLGQNMEALQAAEEAAQTYESLSKSDRATYLPLLTCSLRLLGHLYSRLGRQEQALQFLEQALGYDEELLSRDRSVYLPDYANSLNTLGVAYQKAGHFEKGISFLERAVHIREELAAKNENLHLPDLALSLNDFGAVCRELNRHDEALHALERARRIYEKLVSLDREAHLNNLAMCMDNLGLCYIAYSRFREASYALEQARSIYEELAEVDSQSFLPKLSTTMDSLARCHTAWGLNEDSLAIAEQSLRIHEELVKADRDKYLPGLASSLNNISTYYRLATRDDDALSAAQRAVAIYGELATSDDDANLANLAMSLDNLGSIYADLSHAKDAFGALERSVDIYEKLAERCPEVYLSELAVVLNNISGVYLRFGANDKALRAIAQAVEIREELVQSNREVYLGVLANSLNNLAAVYAEIGRSDEALSVTKRVVDIREELATSGNEVWIQKLAEAVAHVATICRRMIRFSQALAASERLVSIYEELYKLRAEKYKPCLAESLSMLALACVRAGENTKALPPAMRAVSLYEELCESQEENFLPKLIENLSVLGTLLQLNGHWDEAVPVCLRGIRTLHAKFLQEPQTYADAMKSLVGGYLASCGKAGMKPEDSLVEPLIEKLEDLGPARA